jgi:peptidoglycan/LPS O-acetylase OafA/YrhL
MSADHAASLSGSPQSTAANSETTFSRSKGRTQRIAVLDQLRACAVLLVVINHAVQMSPVPLPGLNRITFYGQYGVDLFFVLSGWLIGGLYWKEMNILGRVHKLRFWSRRWMRTLPPYFAALLLSWLAVWWARSEAFDGGYFVFLQNYHARIPYFLVSWSLCIEEHFYLVAPVVATLLIIALPRKSLWLVWVLLMVISPYFRWLAWPQAETGDFGYYETATHLRLDGLVLGFGISYVAIFAPGTFKMFARSVSFLIPVCIVGIVVLERAGGLWRYALFPELIAVLCTSLVVIGVSSDSSKRPSFISSIFPWGTIAIASYSAYLVHPLAIHIARSAVSSVGLHNWLLYWPVVFILIILSTAAFYGLVERPSILLRDEWVPSLLGGRVSTRDRGAINRQHSL